MIISGLSEIVNHTYLVKISGDTWTTFTGDDLGFNPYYFGIIRTNSKNELWGTIDYSLSSALYPNGPQVFKFDGDSCMQFKFDDFIRLRLITMDQNDNVWGIGDSKYFYYNENRWIAHNLKFNTLGVFVIETSTDNKIWIGTGDGIYVLD